MLCYRNFQPSIPVNIRTRSFILLVATHFPAPFFPRSPFFGSKPQQHPNESATKPHSERIQTDMKGQQRTLNIKMRRFSYQMPTSTSIKCTMTSDPKSHVTYRRLKTKQLSRLINNIELYLTKSSEKFCFFVFFKI